MIKEGKRIYEPKPYEQVADYSYNELTVLKYYVQMKFKVYCIFEQTLSLGLTAVAQ